ncbi:hypothetical protein LIER_39019 [Lithospermum erythrorhizon]|uniref:Surfeit locus protein 2 n=1 Tax=Lithospermum erythrorhizon TaxID=34254 RepID=A0AAV3QAB6_LITER
MGKKEGKMNSDIGGKKDSEGLNLLGSPRFKDIGNGRFRCVETGHELPAHSKDSYSLTKHCRLGLINSALSKNKPPLNMFRQDPQSSSKLICKLTGDIINKNEQHIWKHINGKHFLSVLEQKEVEQEAPKELVEKKKGKGEKKGNRNGKRDKKAEAEDLDKKIKKQEEEVEKDISLVKEKKSDPDEDIDFWMPPAGERWDNDDGGDRWGSDTEDDSADEKDGDSNVDNNECAVELSKRKECMPQETEGSSFVSRKKMKKKTVTEGCVKGTSSGLESNTASS